MRALCGLADAGSSVRVEKRYLGFRSNAGALERARMFVVLSLSEKDHLILWNKHLGHVL